VGPATEEDGEGQEVEEEVVQMKRCRNCETTLSRRQKMFCSHRCQFLYRWQTDFGPGEKSPGWRGGKTKITRGIRATYEYRRWRTQVLERDGYRCVGCAATENLHVDHIKAVALFPELIFDMSNGRTLCFDCHRKTSSWGHNLNIDMAEDLSSEKLVELFEKLRLKKRVSKLSAVVELNAAGLCSSEIARRLGLGRSTVNHYLRQGGLINAQGGDKRKKSYKGAA
jgi:predicted nucleic acid-binding Zn ribbon protein